MNWYLWILILSFAICFIACFSHLIHIIRLGKPKDYARKAGNVSEGVKYSLTKAMSPKAKESAYLHLPAYAAGLLFHAGTFLSFVLLIFNALGVSYLPFLKYLFTLCLIASVTGGVFILFKRLTNKQLRSLSNPDDFISNVLVNFFQILTLLVFWTSGILPVYFITAAILFLYIPLGKLKHLLYFFAARYHLGFFYGWRNIWPPAKSS